MLSRILIAALAAALAACVPPRFWAPPPPSGEGYEYRFTGTHRRIESTTVDSYRIGKVHVTDFYSYRSRATSEVADPFLRASREVFAPGAEAQGKFNEHLATPGRR
jgi:hypothetical protein